MNKEDSIREGFENRFDFLKNAVKIVRPRRVSIEVPYDKFDEAFRFAVVDQKFAILCTITGLDEGERLGFIYHLSQETGIVMNLKTSVPKLNPVIKTITGFFPVADIYEREMTDLLGVRVDGLLPGNRYPLTDDWPLDEHPLRKDWKPKDAAEDRGEAR